MQVGPPIDLIGLLKLTIILKMLLFLLLKKVQDELVEDLQKVLVSNLPMKDHLLKALIHHQQGTRGQGITVQDLMINPTLIIY